MKKSDRVKVNFDTLPDCLARDSSNPDGVEGTVTSIDNGGEKNDFKILVTWDNGFDNAYDKSHLIII